MGLHGAQLTHVPRRRVPCSSNEAVGGVVRGSGDDHLACCSVLSKNPLPPACSSQGPGEARLSRVHSAPLSLQQQHKSILSTQAAVWDTGGVS